LFFSGLHHLSLISVLHFSSFIFRIFRGRRRRWRSRGRWRRRGGGPLRPWS